MYQEQEKETIQIDVASMHRDMKSAAIAFTGVIVIALAFTMGPAFITFLYFCVALVGVLGYAMYPEQCDNFFKRKQLHLLGASLGFFVAGPLGLLLGAWLVHYTAEKLNIVARQAETVQNAAKTLISPLGHIKSFFARAKDTAADVFDVLSQMEPNFTFPETDEDPETMAEASHSEHKERISMSDMDKMQEPSPIMSWFYRNLSLLPPAIPTLPSAHVSPSAQDETTGTTVKKLQV